jgi:hypothetical protein
MKIVVDTYEYENQTGSAEIVIQLNGGSVLLQVEQSEKDLTVNYTVAWLTSDNKLVSQPEFEDGPLFIERSTL